MCFNELFFLVGCGAGTYKRIIYKAIKRIYLIQYLNKRRNKKMAVPLKTPKMYFFQHANWLRKTTELSFVKLNLYFECLCKICVKVTLYE